MRKKTMILGALICMFMVTILPANAEALHNIQKGESLYKIAVNNGVSVSELKQANDLSGDLIYAGDKLAIPTETSSKALNSRDLELLARLITAEAGGEPFEGQVAVASVIFNRMQDQKFPATVAGNIFKPHEFESVSNGLIWEEPTSESYRAAEAALKGWDPTQGAKYFFNPAKVNGPSWIWTRTIIDRIGQHVFGI